LKNFWFLDVFYVTSKKKEIMKTQINTIRYGLQMFIAVVAYFFLMKLFNLEKVTELRFFNILIIAYFTYALARKNAERVVDVGYLNSLGSLFVANCINVVLSVLGLYVYISFIDPGFIHNFEHSLLFGSIVTLPKICLGTLMEGIAGSIIVSFAMMQYWKREIEPARKV